MNDGDGLRAAILAEPDDDIARLVYADWLDENGQPAAGRVRPRTSRAAQSEPFSPEAGQYDKEATKALGTNRGAWTKHLVQWVARCEFRRGFVEHAQVNAASFPRDAADLFATEPIRSLHLVRYPSPDPEETVSLLPFFLDAATGTRHHLDFTGVHLSPVELEPIGECPFLDKPDRSHLGGLPVMPDWLAGVLDGLALPAFDRVEPRGLGAPPHRARGHVSRGRAPRFARLDLSRIPFTSWRSSACSRVRACARWRS